MLMKGTANDMREAGERCQTSKVTWGPEAENVRHREKTKWPQEKRESGRGSLGRGGKGRKWRGTKQINEK